MARRTTIQPYVNSIKFNGASSFLAKASPVGVNTGTDSRFGMVRIFLTTDALGTVFMYKCNSQQSPGILIGQLAGVYYFALDTINPTNNLTMTAAEFKRYFPMGKWIELAWLITNTTITIWADKVPVKNAVSWGVPINTLTYDAIFWGKIQNSVQTDLYLLNGYMKDGFIGNGTITQTDVDNFFYDGILPAGVTDRYAMSEGSGTNVASTGSNSMTATSIAWSTLVPMRERQTAGERSSVRDIPYSIYINGVDGAINNALSAANIAAFNGLTQYTTEIRFYPTVAKAHILYDNSQGGVTDSFLLSMDTNYNLFAYQTIGGIARNITGVSGRARPNQFNTIQVAYNGSLVSIFLNGALVGTIAATGALGSNSTTFRIGAYYTGASSLTFKGYLYRPRVYGIGITLAEARNVHFHDVITPAMQSSLILDAAMTEGSGSTIADASGNGNTLTLGPSASWSTITPSRLRANAGARTNI
jgi:hypothetical protein